MSMFDLWWLSLAIFVVVIVVVAVLLGLIIAAAKSIDRHAGGIWTVGKQIAGNTVAIWMLEQTNRNLAGMLDSTRAMEQTSRSMDERLRALADTGQGRS